MMNRMRTESHESYDFESPVQETINYIRHLILLDKFKLFCKKSKFKKLLWKLDH